MVSRSLLHYQILRKLGAGGMGEVYLAEDSRLGRIVALKSLPETFTQDEERLRRFAQEAKSVSDNTDYLRYVEKNNPSRTRWQHVQPQGVVFTYRETPQYFQTIFVSARPQIAPPPTLAGMVEMTLDSQGRLLRFSAVPQQADQVAAAAPDWASLFLVAGLDMVRFAPTEPQWTPSTAFDARAAWTGTVSDQPSVPLRIEAAAWRGKAVHFGIVYPWTMQTQSGLFLTFAQFPTLLAIFLLIVSIGSALIARSNDRRGRGDRQGAFKLFCLMFALQSLMIVFGIHYIPTARHLLNDLLSLIVMCLAPAAGVWLSYLALEPYVRRYWPDSIISWSRVLTGRWRDARVGRDVLIGLLGGISIFLLGRLATYLTGHINELAPNSSDPSLLSALYGIRGASGAFFGVLSLAISNSVLVLVMLFLLRALLRRQWLAAVIFIVVLDAGFPQMSYLPWVSVPLIVLLSAIVVILALRYGLLTLIAAEIAANLLRAFPTTTNFSAWYAGIGLIGPLAVLVLAAFAFHTSLGGQKVFAGTLLEE